MKIYVIALLAACSLRSADSELKIEGKTTISPQPASYLHSTKPKSAEEHSKEKTKKCLTGCGFCCGLTAIVALLTCGSCSGNCI